MPGRMGECLLGRQFDLGMRQAGNVGELPGDFGREEKEFVHPSFYGGANLSVPLLPRQAPTLPQTAVNLTNGPPITA